MIVNMIRFSFRDDWAEADKQKVLEAITRTSKMDCVSFGAVGKDIGNPADGFTHTYCAAIADLNALEQYFANPIHREGDFLFLPAISKLYRVAMTDDFNPKIQQDINAIWQGVMEKDPEWMNLFDLIEEVHM